MIEVLPQIEKISVLKSDQNVVLRKVKAGPVLLLQRSNPAAVLLSPEHWNQIALRLKELERREEIRRRLQDEGPDVSFEEFMADLEARDADYE